MVDLFRSVYDDRKVLFKDFRVESVGELKPVGFEILLVIFTGSALFQDGIGKSEDDGKMVASQIRVSTHFKFFNNAADIGGGYAEVEDVGRAVVRTVVRRSVDVIVDYRVVRASKDPVKQMIADVVSGR